MSPRIQAGCGAVSGLFAVAAGAFGAHFLKTRLAPDLFEIFETGVFYQMVHALALLALAALSQRAPTAAGSTAGWLFLVGTVLFSGSLYALAFTGWRGLGAVTPFGGAAFLAGWACLIAAVQRL